VVQTHGKADEARHRVGEAMFSQLTVGSALIKIPEDLAEGIHGLGPAAVPEVIDHQVIAPFRQNSDHRTHCG
jgi:hypothetical protein